MTKENRGMENIRAPVYNGGEGVDTTTGRSGGDRGNRTPNLGIANAALSLVELYPLMVPSTEIISMT